MQIHQLWTEMPKDLRDHLTAHAKALEFKRGESVYRQGDEPKGLYLVQKGLVGLVITAPQSRRTRVAKQ